MESAVLEAPSNGDAAKHGEPIRRIPRAWCAPRNEVGLKTRMFGGGLVGPQFAALKTQLGPLLNGVVNYEFYAPISAASSPSSISSGEVPGPRGQGRRGPARFLPAAYAYAMMQVLEQAITATKGARPGEARRVHPHEHVRHLCRQGRFAKNGEWAAPRVMMTQYHSITGNDVEQFKKPGRLTVLSPNEYKTGELKAPYHENRK